MGNQASVIVDTSKGQLVKSLRQVDYGKSGISESLLQELIEVNPGLLPVEQFDYCFSPIIGLGREILKMDYLAISPSGFLTIVETKLWRNAESRRKVVAQILEYAVRLSKLTYSELELLVQQKNGFTEPFYDWLVKKSEDDELPPREKFFDAVTRNLASGSFLLMIVGDGIREGVQDLTDVLSKTPQLGFTFGLVELSCYQFEDEKLLLVPSVIGRTKEIERAVVRIEMKSDVADMVTVDAVTKPIAVETSASLQAFFQALEEAVGSKVALDFENFAQGIESELDEVKIACKERYLLKCEYEEDGRTKALWIFAVNRKGRIALGGQNRWFHGSQASREVIESFWESMGGLLPELAPSLTDKGTMSRPGCELAKLMKHRESIREIVLGYARDLTSIET